MTKRLSKLIIVQTTTGKAAMESRYLHNPGSNLAPDIGTLLVAFSAGAFVGLAVGTLIDSLIKESKSAPLALLAPPQRLDPFTLLQFSMPPPDPESDAIRKSAEWHAQRGADVRADIHGWPRPPTLDGRIPDVHADYGDRVVIEEYENDRSISRPHAVEQDVTFTRWANRSHRRHYTQFVVPGGRGGRG